MARKDSLEDKAMDEIHEEENPALDWIASEEAFLQLYGSPQEVVVRYTHCPLCGSSLHFNHLTDFARNLTQETAKCPECSIKVRRVMHRLQ